MATNTDELLRHIDNQHAAVVALHGEGKTRLAQLAEQHNSLSTQVLALQQKMETFGGAPLPAGGGSASGFAHAVTAHAEFATIAALAGRRGKHTMQVRAALTTQTNSGAALVPADKRTDPVALAQQRLTIRDLVAPGQTSSSSVEYARQTVRDLQARIVSEGAVKPESNLAYEIATAPVVTIAHWTKTSRQLLADAPALRTLLDGELRYGVRLAEENEMLFGDGTSGHLTGIVTDAVPYETSRDQSGDSWFDTLAHAMTQSEVALLPATGIVLNTNDLEALKVIKDADGRYIGGGPFGPPMPTIWGRPVVGTPTLPAGSFLVGAFRDGAQLFDREEVSLVISTENEDDFIRNRATALVEERLAFAVKRPQAFVFGEFPA